MLPGTQVIHSQAHFLDDDLLAELRARGIGPLRIRQRQGDAVLIPAGCPHQVRNVSNCIKVAADFLTCDGVDDALAVAAERQLERQEACRRAKLYYPVEPAPPATDPATDLATDLAKDLAKDLPTDLLQVGVRSFPNPEALGDRVPNPEARS